jgi:hypothetical protein
MKKYLAALLVAVGMLLVMAAPAFAQEEFPGQGSGATDPNPGNTEGSRSIQTVPPHQAPGSSRRSTTANEHDEGDKPTGRGKRDVSV